MLLNISPNHWCIVKINSYVIRCAYFARENNLLRLFWGIWVKYHVPLVSLPRNFSLKDSLKNSSLKDIEDTAESRTTEKSEVSSEKGLAFVLQPLSKSLMQAKKDKNFMWPCEDLPLRTTLWCRSLRNECISPY